MSKKKIDTIEKTIVEIKETFKIDYTIPLKMTKKEEQELTGDTTDGEQYYS